MTNQLELSQENEEITKWLDVQHQDMGIAQRVGEQIAPRVVAFMACTLHLQIRPRPTFRRRAGL